MVDTRMCTTLGNGEGVIVSTVEHLMAALSGAHVDNLVVELDGPEVPVMDGSAQPFIFLIECAGIKELNVHRESSRYLNRSESKWMAKLRSSCQAMCFP